MSFRIKNKMPRIICQDGFSISIQASVDYYCEPRSDKGPYTEVELGFPSKPIPELLQYRDGDREDTYNVFSYVPVKLVNALINRHGGVDFGKTLNHKSFTEFK